MATHRRGIVLADAVLGLTLMAFLGGLAVVDMAWRIKADTRLANFRAATAKAESVLDHLQEGRLADVPGAASGAVRIEYFSGGAAVPGYAWVRVEAKVGGQSASLLGLGKGMARK